MKNIMKKLNPTIWDYEIWRKFFLISAVWNFSGAIPGVFYSDFSMRLFYGIQTNNYHTLLLTALFFGAVFMFGIGYLIVAYAPEKNLGIIFLGSVSKAIMAIVWFYLYLFCNDRATIFAAVVATGDLIFAIYFGYYLAKGPRSC